MTLLDQTNANPHAFTPNEHVEAIFADLQKIERRYRSGIATAEDAIRWLTMQWPSLTMAVRAAWTTVDESEEAS